jgi:hypothetical protein
MGRGSAAEMERPFAVADGGVSPEWEFDREWTRMDANAKGSTPGRMFQQASGL